MAGLQRSATTFRRSGSSGLVWDERFLTEAAVAEERPNDCGGACAARQPELRHSRSVGSARMLRRRGRDGAGDVDDKERRVVLIPRARKNDQGEQKEQKEAVVTGNKAFRTREVAPAAEPPSPRVSGCVLCSIFRGPGGQWRGSSAPRARPGKR